MTEDDAEAFAEDHEGPVATALRALLPPLTAPESAYPSALLAVAKQLLNRAVIHVGGQRLRPVEVECYFHGGEHPDDFAHRDPIQVEPGRWYFHRSGGTYKAGSYKGLDITCGHNGAHGGVLLRALAPLDDAASLIDGPSLCVDHLLAAAGASSIATLVARLLPGSPVDRVEQNPFSLTLEDDRHAPVYATPRVGLTLKRGELELRQRFLSRGYRYLTEPARLRKGTPHLIVALCRAGWSDARIAALSGSRPTLVSAYRAAYQRGQARSTEEYRGDLSGETLCEALGACDAAVPPPPLETTAYSP